MGGLLLCPPPHVGEGGAPVKVCAYTDAGPRLWNGTGWGSTLSDGATLTAAGEDLIVLLPGRGCELTVFGAMYGPAHVFDGVPDAMVNPQATPLRRKHGCQVVSLGRHVVCIGGRIDMDRDWTGGTAPIEQANRSWYVTGPAGAPGPTGVIFTEGVLRTGDWQWEDWNHNAASTATLVIQNDKVIAGTDGVSIHYAPTGTTGAGNHRGGDRCQINTMPRAIIVHRAYDAGLTFQAWFFKAEAGNHRPNWLWMDSVLSARYGGPGAWLYLMPDPFGDVCPAVHIGPDVTMQQAPMYGPSADGLTSQPREPEVDTSLANNLWPHDAAWTTSVQQLAPPAPTDPASVLSGEPGMEYVSPGYILAATPDPNGAGPMAVTAKQYGPSNKHLTNGDVNFLTDTIKAALLSAYTPSQAHETWADVIAAGTEASGSGYTARGQALASKTITTSGLVTTLDAADLVWTTSNPGTLAAAYLVYYKDSGTNSTSYVLAYEDFGGTQTASNGGTFTQTVPGIITQTAS